MIASRAYHQQSPTCTRVNHAGISYLMWISYTRAHVHLSLGCETGSVEASAYLHEPRVHFACFVYTLFSNLRIMCLRMLLLR